MQITGKFSEYEDSVLLRMSQEGTKYKYVAQVLTRTTSSVTNRAQALRSEGYPVPIRRVMQAQKKKPNGFFSWIKEIFSY